MEWIEIIVHTTTAGADMVSDCLMQEGASGTMVEDRADIPDPTKPNGIWEIIDPALPDSMPADVLVHAWFTPGAAFNELLSALRQRLTNLAASEPDFGTLKLETRNVRDEDWAENWKKYYKPFRAGKHLLVKPTWESCDPLPGDRVIEIDPGMAFGSGTHETTAMCMELLEKTLRGGERVLDVGTGSGILAICAALCGARSVLAVDIDPDAVRTAAGNVAQNHLESIVTVSQGNLLDGIEAECEVCVANIIADVICTFAAPLKRHILPGGRFVCSGIIREREKDVSAALAAAGYDILEITRRGEWVAFLSTPA